MSDPYSSPRIPRFHAGYELPNQLRSVDDNARTWNQDIAHLADDDLYVEHLAIQRVFASSRGRRIYIVDMDSPFGARFVDEWARERLQLIAAERNCRQSRRAS